MIGPLTALGLASNIVQLVDFGLRTVTTGRELACTGTTAEYKHLDRITSELLSVCAEMDEQRASGQGDNDEALRAQEQGSGAEAEHMGTQAQGTESEHMMHELASEAKDVANELSTMLSKLKLEPALPDGERPTKRRRTAAVRAIKGMWKKKEVEELRHKLEELQRAMVLRLAIIESASSSSLLKATISSSDPRQDRTDRLEKYESVLNAPNSTLDCAGEAFWYRCASLARQVRDLQPCKRVLTSLAFSEIHDRQERIPQAHSTTCSWVFEEEALGFTHWAEKQDGIYWITGKPGSGKSTLMKYLVREPRTKELLRTWAGSDEFAIAYHYFWNAGTEMQKSQLGLLRTLLYHIVQQSAGAILDFIPDRFKTDRGYLTKTEPWTAEELRETMVKFASRPQNGTRLALFIDGLDEYVGQHTDLVQVISALAKCPSIKVCVSSRPWNVFTRAYDKRVDGQLSMQDLTEKDIQLYVNDKMSTDDRFCEMRSLDPDGCRDLVHLITAKAQGVFLWVRLVVLSLLRGLDNDDDLDILQRRVNEYPDTLDAYYRRMLDRIEKVYQTHSARVMLAALFASESPACRSTGGTNGLETKERLWLWTPHCMELELQCPEYAQLLPPATAQAVNGQSAPRQDCGCTSGPRIHGKCLHLWADLLKYRYAPKQRQELRKYLDARCADFLELRDTTVQFIHRTAKDFLEDNALVTLRKRAGVNFDTALSLARARLADIKTSPIDARASLYALVMLRNYILPASVEDYSALLDHLREAGPAFGVEDFYVEAGENSSYVRTNVTGEGEICAYLPVGLVPHDGPLNFTRSIPRSDRWELILNSLS